MSRSVARLAFIVCLQAAMWACASRTTTPGTTLPEPAASPSEPPIAPPPVVEPPAPAPSIPSRPEESSANCALIPEPGEPITTVALSERVDAASAPRPSNESERLVFRQVYETLVRVDCDGHVLPALAASWRRSVDGRTWIVTLRSDAQFSDGDPVTASSVLAGWSRDGAGGELRPNVSRLVQSIVSIDGNTLAITLRSPRADMPLGLAHADLAIAKPVQGSLWPLGTRGKRLTADGENLLVTSTTGDSPSLQFVVSPGDVRDLLDKGVDLLVTREPAALDYAATLTQFQSLPLAWQQIYVLLAPGRTRISPSLPEGARQALAADAIRGEARGAEGPFWWQTLPDCEIADPQPRGPSSGGRIVYDGRDSAARDLAERFVALAAASGSGPAALVDALFPDRAARSTQRAAGLTGEALVLARRRGIDAAYIVAFDRRPLDPCRELQAVVEGAPWLDPETAVPLVDTRLRAIVRRGRSGVDAEWDGGLLIAAREK
jgi:hypothetical protein